MNRLPRRRVNPYLWRVEVGGKAGTMGGDGGADVTAVMTSCGRFDLLERALASFLAVNRAPLARFLLIEDSGDEAAREVARAADPGIEVIVNPARLGQHRSIDRAYATVTTPLIFHMEDDWVFDRGGFIEDGREILMARPDVSMVSGRPIENFRYPGPKPPLQRIGTVDYWTPPRDLHPSWFGYALHPGLRRLAEWRRFGPFARHPREWDISYAMKRAGFRMAFLEPGRYREEGQHDPRAATDPARPSPLSNRLRKAAKKALFAVERRLGRYAD